MDRRSSRLMRTIMASTAVVLVASTSPRTSTASETHVRFSREQDDRCGRVGPNSWVDTMAARQLYEAALEMEATASRAHRAYRDAFYRRNGWVEGNISEYFVSAREVAAGAVQLDPTNHLYVLFYATLGYQTAYEGEGRIDVLMAREWLRQAQCAVHLSTVAQDSVVEHRAKYLVRQIEGAIRANEPR